MINEGQLHERLKACPLGGTLWRHYKGNLYVVLGFAILESTLEPAVLYHERGGGIPFCRPLSEWRQTVNVDGKDVQRFTPEAGR